MQSNHVISHEITTLNAHGCEVIPSGTSCRTLNQRIALSNMTNESSQDDQERKYISYQLGAHIGAVAVIGSKRQLTALAESLSIIFDDDVM